MRCIAANPRGRSLRAGCPAPLLVQGPFSAMRARPTGSLGGCQPWESCHACLPASPPLLSAPELHNTQGSLNRTRPHRCRCSCSDPRLMRLMIDDNKTSRKMSPERIEGGCIHFAMLRARGLSGTAASHGLCHQLRAPNAPRAAPAGAAPAEPSSCRRLTGRGRVRQPAAVEARLRPGRQQARTIEAPGGLTHVCCWTQRN